MTDDQPTSDETTTPADEASRGTDESPERASVGGRDVAVPMELYKVVTVFSTLIAVVFVVLGFVVLDEATQRATAAPDEVNVLLALVGLGAIAFGAGTYAFSTRFRAGGMGNPKDEGD